MSRILLDQSALSEKAAQTVTSFHKNTVDEAVNAVSNNKVAVIGMKGNPHCKRAIKYLNNKNIDHCYLEYGSYLKEWKRRLALKMWTGWPTYPMVFVEGKLIGGANELSNFLKTEEGKSL